MEGWRDERGLTGTADDARVAAAIKTRFANGPERFSPRLNGRGYTEGPPAIPHPRGSPSPPYFLPIRSGGTPARTAINAHTFGTYMRVSAGSASAIAVNVFAFCFFSVRLTRPSPAL